MRKASLAITLGIGTALAAIGPAQADLTIDPHGNTGGVQAQVEPGGGFPLNLFGYTSPASLIADVAGFYTFTYEGAGNATNHNTFTLNGATIFDNTTSTVGNQFTLFLPAGPISFDLHSVQSGCNLVGDTASTQAGCNYLIALANSVTAPGATGPSTQNAWIGFSDGFTSDDHDFQDMAVLVTEQVPEPASLALLGAALLGFAGFRWNASRKS